MDDIYYDETFSRIDYTKTGFRVGEYERCTFVDCNLANVDLSSSKFIECVFQGCNLSLARLMETGMQEVRFDHCRLHGLDWSQCSTFLFDVGFESCQLQYSTFSHTKLQKTIFSDCELIEVDFGGADLTGASLARCDCTRAIFRDTNLTDADLSTSYGYMIHPESNRIRGATFSLDGLPGLLAEYHIIVA